MINPEPINNPLIDAPINGTTFFSNFVGSLVTILFVVGVVVFVLILIISAINWITSGGDKAKTADARSRMVNAFIGLIILFSVYAILALVSEIFSISLVEIDPGDLNIL